MLSFLGASRGWDNNHFGILINLPVSCSLKRDFYKMCGTEKLNITTTVHYNAVVETS